MIVLSEYEPGAAAANPKAILRTHPLGFGLATPSGEKVNQIMPQIDKLN